MNSFKIVFMGTPDFAVESLDTLLINNYEIKAVVTAPDKKSGRGNKINFSEVKKYSIKKNLRILQPSNLKEESFVKELKQINADIFIVVAFRMLPKTVWEIPKNGTINLHASLLPQLRGAAPIHWAIINGLKNTGLTTFFINEKIDFGNIIEQKKIKIDDSENTGSLYKKLKRNGSLLIISTLKLIIKGDFQSIEQNDFKFLIKAPKLDKENTRINWESSGLEIYNMIRGLSPYPTAWTKEENNNKIIKLFKVIFKKEQTSIENNGMLYIDQNLIKIYVKDGFLEVLELQIEGKKKMSSTEFINGYKNYNSTKLF